MFIGRDKLKELEDLVIAFMENNEKRLAFSEAKDTTLLSDIKVLRERVSSLELETQRTRGGLLYCKNPRTTNEELDDLRAGFDVLLEKLGYEIIDEPKKKVVKDVTKKEK